MRSDDRWIYYALVLTFASLLALLTLVGWIYSREAPRMYPAEVEACAEACKESGTCMARMSPRDGCVCGCVCDPSPNRLAVVP